MRLKTCDYDGCDLRKGSRFAWRDRVQRDNSRSPKARRLGGIGATGRVATESRAEKGLWMRRGWSGGHTRRLKGTEERQGVPACESMSRLPGEWIIGR